MVLNVLTVGAGISEQNMVFFLLDSNFLIEGLRLLNINFSGVVGEERGNDMPPHGSYFFIIYIIITVLSKMRQRSGAMQIKHV